MEINERIKNRRKELDLDADRVAEQLGISRATYYRYESKDIEKIPIAALVPLATVLRTTPAYIMGWDEEKELPLELSTAEIQHIKKYRLLDEGGKGRIDRQIDFELYQQEQDAEKDEQNLG